VNTRRAAAGLLSPVPWLGGSLRGLRRVVGEHRVWIAALISLVCLFLALRRVTWQEVFNGLQTADYRLIAVAMIMQAGAVSSTALRWRALFYPHRGLRAAKFITVAFIGELVNTVLPARVGSLARIYLIGRMEQVSRAFALGTVVAEKAADGIVLTTLCLLLLPVIALPASMWRTSLLGTGMLVLGVLGLTVPALVRRAIHRSLAWLAAKVPVIEHVHLPDVVRSGLEGMRALLSRDAALQIWGWSALMWGLGGLINLVVLRAAGLPAGPITALALLVILQVGTKVPSLPAGFGVLGSCYTSPWWFPPA
jgi:uncharacterized protein (TIRG00374 family)